MSVAKTNVEIVSGRKGDEPFNKPWELRAFALAVAACEAGKFEWASFQEALTAALQNAAPPSCARSADDGRYYEHFLTALEVVLAQADVLERSQLENRARTILETPPHKHHVAKYDPIAIDPATA